MQSTDNPRQEKPKDDSEVCQEGRAVCECLAQMGNDYWFLPTGQCIFKEHRRHV